MNNSQAASKRFNIAPKLRMRRKPMSYERLAILLAVAAGPIAGPEISEQVVADTVGGIVISKSTGYRLINELVERGLIELNRGGYMLTNAGWRTLRAELNRIENQIRILKTRLHI